MRPLSQKEHHQRACETKYSGICRKKHLFRSRKTSSPLQSQNFLDGVGCPGADMRVGRRAGISEVETDIQSDDLLRSESWLAPACQREISLTHSKPCTAPPHSRSRPPRAASVHVGVIVWGGCVGGADPTTTNTPNFTRATISC